MKLHLRGTYANQNLGWKRLLLTSYFKINPKTSISGLLFDVLLDKYLPTFRRIVMPHIHGKTVQEDTSKRRQLLALRQRPETSALPPWKTHISPSNNYLTVSMYFNNATRIHEFIRSYTF